MFLQLGKTPLLRAMNVFVPMFLSAGAFYAVLFTTIEPDYALLAGVVTATVLWVLWGRLDWSLSSPAAIGIAFFIAYFVSVFETVYGALPTLVLWVFLSGYLAHHAALRARKSIKGDTIIVVDLSISPFDWMVYEFLAYQSFFVSLMLLIQKPDLLYVLPALFVGVFVAFMVWALVAKQKARTHSEQMERIRGYMKTHRR